MLRWHYECKFVYTVILANLNPTEQYCHDPCFWLPPASVLTHTHTLWLPLLSLPISVSLLSFLCHSLNSPVPLFVVLSMSSSSNLPHPLTCSASSSQEPYLSWLVTHTHCQIVVKTCRTLLCPQLRFPTFTPVTNFMLLTCYITFLLGPGLCSSLAKLLI